jgi:2-(1,2-epoxy-1,2-dihydrophenyl)acetyl-CoA isomerase
MDQLQYDREGERVVLTLDNPESKNALSVGMARSIRNAMEKVEDSDARCVVVQGTPGAFCAGGDIESMLQAVSSDADLSTLVEEIGGPVNRTVQDIYECSVPTIAKVDGPAYGAGASLAVACDLVLASERATFSFGFQRIGLSIDSGTSYLLPRIVGENTANRLVLTDDVVDAEEAVELGIAQELYPTETFDERAEAVIEPIATGPTVALSNSKALIQNGLDRSIDEAIDHEIESLKEIFETQDFAEGVSAFMTDSEPEFRGE